jgi:hypothetical protein
MNLAIRMKQLLGTLADGNNPAEAVKAVNLDFVRSQIPEVDTISDKGQLMMDAQGNMFTIYPDGRIEPYVKKDAAK